LAALYPKCKGGINSGVKYVSGRGGKGLFEARARRGLISCREENLILAGNGGNVAREGGGAHQCTRPQKGTRGGGGYHPLTGIGGRVAATITQLAGGDRGTREADSFFATKEGMYGTETEVSRWGKGWGVNGRDLNDLGSGWAKKSM